MILVNGPVDLRGHRALTALPTTLIHRIGARRVIKFVDPRAPFLRDANTVVIYILDSYADGS